jgi:MFS superfamily sulfate permease-like transporter
MIVPNHLSLSVKTKDASAGITVFILLIPQGLAYALLGGESGSIGAEQTGQIN